jgi:hypothetical protein
MCGKPFTVGVCHRVEKLADVKRGIVRSMRRRSVR